MNLYRFELYRICRRRILLLIAAAMLIWLVFFCWRDISEECSYVDGVIYTGPAAVRMDRAVTEPYEGALTDRLTAGIAAQYGFPTQVKIRTGWLDANYLTRFVTTYLSDGQLQDWDDYTVAHHTIPLADSWMSQYLEEDGTLTFGYAQGYRKLIGFVQMGAYFASVFLIIALAPLFSEDRQLNTRELIFTTADGKGQDVRARVAAALTVTLFVCATFMIPLILLVGSLYGYGGGGMRAGAVLYHPSLFFMTKVPISVFTAIYLMTVCGALLMLAAMSILLSALVKSTFHSVLASMIVWGGPVALFLTFRSRYIYAVSSLLPFTLVNYTSLIENRGTFARQLSVMIIVTVAGMVCGARRWSRVDRE